jgi:biopolymer transport protein ExbB
MRKLLLICLLPFFSVIAEENPSMQKEKKLEKPITKIIDSEQHSSILNIREIFFSAPIIYSLLFIMSIFAGGIWLYSLMTFKEKNFIPKSFIQTCRYHLAENEESKVFELCRKEGNLLAKMLYTALFTKNLGPEVMIDSMKSEGQRESYPFWQRLTVLNDIVTIAPMLGLLGTVTGMFYAFYDMNRSVESINALFDGLGIAVGTTVAGLLVAITSMIFSTTLKYRLSKLVTSLEKEALLLARLINPSLTKEKELAVSLQKKGIEKNKTIKAKR